MRSEALTRFSTPPYSLRVPLLLHHTAPQPPLQKGPPKEALSKKKKRKKEKERKEAVATKHRKKQKEARVRFQNIKTVRKQPSLLLHLPRLTNF
jgi:hypothetical protein